LEYLQQSILAQNLFYYAITHEIQHQNFHMNSTFQTTPTSASFLGGGTSVPPAMASSNVHHQHQFS
jgi:hypothetical protein